MAFTKKLAAIVAFVLVAPAAPALAVVNPDPVLSRNVPSAVVALHFSSDLSPRSQFCTGTLIAKNWVLTAGHCIITEFGEPADISVVAQVGSERVSRKVSLVRVHPEYRSTRTKGTQNDIALMRLAYPLYGVKPIASARPKDVSAGIYQSNLILYGWGRVLRGSSEDRLNDTWTSPLKPRAVRQLEIPVDQVPIGFDPELHLPTLNVSSGGLIQGSCHGDSGGPVIGRVAGVPKVVAIVSYGVPDCLADIAGINTKTAPLWGWVSKTIKSLAKG